MTDATPPREPALYLTVVSAGLSFLVALNVGLSPEQAGLIVAAITAVLGAIATVVTRPIMPALFTTAVVAVADLLAGFHYDLSPGLVAAVNGTLLAILMFVTRGQVTPAITPTRG